MEKTKENKYLRLVSDIIIFILGTVLAKIIQFLLMPLYTTFMTTEAYGVAELIYNMSELLFPVVTICIYEAAFRYIIGSNYTSKEIFSASIRVLFLSSLFGGVLLILSNCFIHYEYATYLYFILYAYSARMLLAYYVRGKGHSKIFALSGIINAATLAFFSFLFIAKFDMKVDGYLLSIALSYTTSGIFLLLFGKVFKDLTLSHIDRNVYKDLLSYSAPLVIYNIGYWFTTMIGRYILLWNTDASTTGMYIAVMKLSSVINMIQQAFYAAFQLNNSREYDNDAKEKFFSNIFKWYAAIINIGGAFIICITPLLAKFTLKNEFFQARIYLSLILYIAIVDCLFVFFKTMYTTYKLTKKAIPSMMIGTIVNVVIALLLVKKLEIWGICIASLCCYLTQAIYRIWDTKKFVNITCNWKVVFSSLLLLFIQTIIMVNPNVMNIIVSVILAIVILVINVISITGDLKIIANKVLKRR